MDRTKGIGGSDVAAICGVSPWKTPLQIYLEKIGESAGSPDNPAMAYGRMVEPVILQWYEQYTGQTVAVPGPLQHPRYPYLIAHLDGLTPDRVIEIKTARSSVDWGNPGTDQIPVAAKDAWAVTKDAWIAEDTARKAALAVRNAAGVVARVIAGDTAGVVAQAVAEIAAWAARKTTRDTKAATWVAEDAARKTVQAAQAAKFREMVSGK